MRSRVVLVAVLVLVLGAWTCAPTSPGSGGSDVPGVTTTGLTSLLTGEGWHYVGSGGGEPAFNSTWANVSSLPKLAFRIRESGVVDVQGVVVHATDGNGTAIFTLPEGYRPSVLSYIPIALSDTTTGPAGGYMSVSTSGAITPFFTVDASQVYIYAQVFLAPPAVA